MPTIKDDGSNPLVIVSKDEVVTWLRQLANEAGFADRAPRAVQMRYEDPNGDVFLRYDVPELLIMVSNIPDSETK
jgi:hypothetical protein